MSPTTTSTIKSPRSGCATSLRQATSRPVTSTNATSATCIPTTFVHTPSAISSQASASGPTRFVAPDGPTIDLFGRVQALIDAANGKEGHARSRAQKAVLGGTAARVRPRKQIEAALAEATGERLAALRWVLGIDDAESAQEATE